MIELRHVSKTYGNEPALQPLDLALPPEKITVLLGPSGCGKSTLLRLMIGLLQPDTGEVRFDNVALTPQNVLRVRHRIGYVLQEGGLFPHLTARQNVTLMARYLRWAPAKINARVDELRAADAPAYRQPRSLPPRAVRWSAAAGRTHACAHARAGRRAPRRTVGCP